MIKLQLTTSDSMDILVNLYSRLERLNQGELSFYNQLLANFSKSSDFRKIILEDEQIRNFFPDIENSSDDFFEKILCTFLQSEIDKKE